MDSMEIGVFVAGVALLGVFFFIIKAARRKRSAIAPGPPESPQVDATPTEKPSLRSESELTKGLEKTRTGFVARLNQLLFSRTLDDDLLEELEALLVTADVGIRTTEVLLESLRTEFRSGEKPDGEAIRNRLRTKILELISGNVKPLSWNETPLVIMVIGVNGVGKTTTIGKLAARFSEEGKKVVLAAGDTFRAAAVEQLEIWAERSGAILVKGSEGSDPSSVVYEAVERARSLKADVCICDTAGRLHTKVNLMEELKKMSRVLDKAHAGAPHEVLMVLDATTGQNGISQAKKFQEAVTIDSIALTKLDGTAKGGVVVAISHDLDIPVRYVGVGEQIKDLRDFKAHEFVNALFSETEPVLTASPEAPKVLV